jgi:hypothetical protein
MTNRRKFLQATTSIAAAGVLSNFTFASPTPTIHFIQTITLHSWPIANPAQRCLDNKHDLILERAFDGLCSHSESVQRRSQNSVLFGVAG